VETNLAFAYMLGYTPTEVLQLNVADWEVQLSRAELAVAINDHVANPKRFEEPLIFETRHRRKDGSTIDVQISIIGVTLDGGKYLYCCSRDVTARKRSEAALRESEQMLKHAQRCARIGNFRWTAETNQVVWSDELYRIYGRVPGEFAPSFDNYIAAMHADDRTQVVETLRAAMLPGGKFAHDYRMVLPEGKVIWVHARGRALEDESGNFLGLEGTCQDITERKEMEKALQQSQSLLLSITEGTSDAIYVKDLEGRYLLFNAASSRYVGKPAEEVLGKDGRALFPPDQADVMMNLDRQVIQSGLTQTYDEHLSTTAGETVFLSTKGPIRDSNGQIIGLFGIARDITERKQAEAILSRSEERLEHALDATQDGIWDWNIATGEVYFSPQWARLLGYAPEEVPPNVEFFFTILHPEDVERVKQSLDEHFAGLIAVKQGEVRLKTKSGDYRWFFDRGKIVARDEDGQPLRMVGTISDITERKQMELALQSSEAKFRAIAQSSPIPIVLSDEHLRITFLNPAFIQTFGYDLTDVPSLLDWRPKAYPDPEYRTWVIREWEAEIKRSSESRSTFSPLELKIRCKDGSVRFALASATPILSGIDGARLIMLVDVTERRNIENNLVAARAAAEAANLAKSEFLANMSHEIRTPLTAMMGYVDMLYEEATDSQITEHRLQVVNTIKNSGSHLLTILNDILDLSKIEANRMSVEQVDTRLIDVLSEVEKLMFPKAAGKGINLSVLFSNPLPDTIKCDPTRLRQILLNLVGNATKFTETGSVTISAGSLNRDGAPRLIVDITDTGPGIAPNKVHQLFTLFGQADGSITRKHGGAGLGLSLSRRFANIMGGNVLLLHSELGKGSCFRIDLPLLASPGSVLIADYSATQAPVRPESLPAQMKLSGRILLAEDGPDNQRLIAFILRKAGATVETADNGAIALSMLDQAEESKTPFDLLLTDIQMPEMDGYTLATTLRERGSKLPIIALTAYAMADDREKCIRAGCNDYATKPIDKAVLIATCAAWIDRSKS
jgi:PAS domain S-box-containing protein